MIVKFLHHPFQCLIRRDFVQCEVKEFRSVVIDVSIFTKATGRV